LKLRGTYRRDRDSGGKIEPEPLRSLRCPVELRTDKLAAGFWKEHAGQLRDLGLLTELDKPAFTLLCQIHGMMRREEAILQQEGSTYQSGTLTKQNPRFNVVTALRRDFDTLSGKFGMSPKSRRGIPLREIEPSEESAFDRFLAQSKRKNRARSDGDDGPDDGDGFDKSG